MCAHVDTHGQLTCDGFRARHHTINVLQGKGAMDVVAQYTNLPGGHPRHQKSTWDGRIDDTTRLR